MTGPLGIRVGRLAAWPRQDAPDLWSMPTAETVATLRALAEDMEAAAVDAGDQAPAGAGRAFAAQRAVCADELRDGLSAYLPDENDDEEEEESLW